MNYELILKRFWGYDNFRGIQREIIESISAGNDTLGLMPTGGGKSVTFQVPALTMQGVCIVVTPLISLMKDQVDNLRRKGIKAYAVYSGMSRSEILATLENCIFSDVKFLYVSPERLSSDLFKAKLKRMTVSFITVDEAHCISQWGYDFRPAYLEIAAIRRLLPHAPVLALTATATPAVVDDIQRQLTLNSSSDTSRPFNVFRMSFARANLYYVVRTAADKLAELLHILSHTTGSAIVYVRSRKRCKEIAAFINENLGNQAATFYHAGLEPTVKDQRQDDWQNDRVRVMVATNAFGMGIDKSDVRTVVHIDPPSSIEAYFQEAGRAGRDGNKAYAVLLYNNADELKLRKRVADTFPEKDYIRTIYDQLAYFYQIGVGSGGGHTFEFNIDLFCTTYRQFPVRVNAALVILQRAGYISYEPEPDNSARVKFILSRDDLYRLNDSSPHENAVITALLRNYGGLFTDYAYIDEAYLAQEAKLDRTTTYQTLRQLSQRRILDFIPRRSVPLLTYTVDRELSDRLLLTPAVYEERLSQFQQRISAMLRYAKDDSCCRSRQLLAYFGETAASDCCHCDVCLAQSADHLSAHSLAPVRQHILQLLADGKEHHVTDLLALSADSSLVDAALAQLLAEEEILADGSLLVINTPRVF